MAIILSIKKNTAKQDYTEGRKGDSEKNVIIKNYLVLATNNLGLLGSAR